MSNTFSFEEQPFEAYYEFDAGETDFNLENFESGLNDWEWEEEVQRGQSPSTTRRSDSSVRGCPPFELNCPFPVFESRRKYLCDRILGAIKLAKKTAAELEAKPNLRQDTVNKFFWIFGQRPSDHWPLPRAPRRTMRAGDIVASRFRAVEKGLRTRNTLYRCLCNGSGGSPGREEPYHPTETIVRDPNAWAVLCQNEVRLCPPFWQLKKPEWQEGTILHEMFHLCFGLTCAWFQHDPKERRRNNAYCYEAFALGSAAEPGTIDKCRKSLIK